jgi:hypothetical protein
VTIFVQQAQGNTFVADATTYMTMTGQAGMSVYVDVHRLRPAFGWLLAFSPIAS